MNSGLQRPSRIQETIERTEKELLEKIFQRIKDDKKLNISETALIPLARRGIGILPRMDDKRSQKNDLVHILNEYGYYERYTLFPSIEKLSKCRTVVVFDDVCETGRSLKQYREYLINLANKLENLDYNEKNIKTAAYIIDKEKEKEYEPDYLGILLGGKEYERKILELYMVIASRGAILDPDHMLIRADFKEAEDFFDVWDELKRIAESNHCDLVEDGIEFLHPTRKKLGFYVKKDMKKNLENLGLNFPDFITKIDIAKFRMVFNLKLVENGIKKSVLTTGFEAVPIVNPFINKKKFSVEKCLSSWCPFSRFCDSLISREYCSKGKYQPDVEYLRKNYYHPRYDCIIEELVRQFKNHFLEEIESTFGDSVIIHQPEWFHQDRLKTQWQKFRNL